MSHDWLRTVGAAYLRRQVGRNLGTVEGLANVPSEGGFVLVPNHTSYLDHFVLDFMLEAVRDGETWFLSKQESFEKPLLRAWTTAWHGIPVDRNRPSSETLRTVQAVLRHGSALCVYPEGTRNPQPESLMDFKVGAFHFAATANVPVVPVLILGADQVLPRGGRRFRRARIDVRFGEPIVPDPSHSKPQRIKQTLTSARTWMEAALEEMQAARARDIIDANRLTTRTTELISRGELQGPRKRALTFVIRSLQRSGPRTVGPVKARARIQGLVALSRPRLLRGPMLMRSETGLRHALRISPRDADAHYYLGTVLALRRGRHDEAREHLEIAARLTHDQDPRPLIALAQAEVRSGDRERAHELLTAASTVLDDRDECTPVRATHIATIRAELERAA